MLSKESCCCLSDKWPVDHSDKWRPHLDTGKPFGLCVRVSNDFGDGKNLFQMEGGGFSKKTHRGRGAAEKALNPDLCAILKLQPAVGRCRFDDKSFNIPPIYI
jgi:hypothetical protein